MSLVQNIEADWTWTGSRFEPDIQVIVDANGEIEHVGMLDARPTHRLTDRALLPGFVNAHSHAFQRGLRGCGEVFPKGGGTFWTWRESMYDLVNRLDQEAFYRLTRQAFSEMLMAGITTVGEFHYLHHDASCDGFAFDELVLKAAADVGIRIVLLNTFYQSGGIGMPLENAQRRFATRSGEAFWRQMDKLAGLIDPLMQSLGAAAHSIRAVPPDELMSLYQESRRRHLVLHMHVEEQRQEIDDCVRAYGRAPLALLNGRLAIDNSFTAIHGTHSSPAEMERFIASHGHVCVCPLTEANLGDGVINVPGIKSLPGQTCVGTDSNARICMLEELRWLEYAQRLRGETRGVFRDAPGRVAPALLNAGTVNGASALGIKTGQISPGHLADFVTIDLNSSIVSGWKPETLLDSIIFGGGNEVIAGVCVGGHWHHFARSTAGGVH